MARQRGLRFPDGFLWGTASSSYQCEGGNTNNQWYRWEQRGQILTGEQCGEACDWWENAEDDFALAEQMEHNALRLSLEWSRIEPAEGQWDSAPLDRYRAMLTDLRHRHIKPIVTLHHFTDPLWFTDRGGFEDEANIRYFVRYVTRAVQSLQDLCDFWVTINEPNIYAFMGYVLGSFPPGEHDTIRAAETCHFTFPLNLLLPPIPHASGSRDYHGVNYYTREMVRFDPTRPAEVFGRRFVHPNTVRNDPGKGVEFGEIYPYGIYRVLKSLYYRTRWFNATYTTENGFSDAQDDRRPRAILEHLAMIHRAISEGIPVSGYLYWTLVDNFEWAAGWGVRFGLVELDPETQDRIPRSSASMFGEICRANAITEEIVERYAPKALDFIFRASNGAAQQVTV